MAKGARMRAIWLRRACCFIAIGVSASSAPAFAEEPRFVEQEEVGFDDLETLLATPIEVWSAARTKQRLEEAPAVISVITKEELDAFGYQSLAEVLKMVTGFYVIDDHSLPNLATRGVVGSIFSESGAVKIMIDGVPVIFRPMGSHWLGPELIALSSIQHIEVIRGPASALYGAGAFLGVVNIVTRKPGQVAGSDVRGHWSETSLGRGGWGLDGTYATARGDLEVLMSARLHAEDRSRIELPQSSPNPRVAYYNADHREAQGLTQDSKVALFKLSQALLDVWRLELFGYYSEIERGAEFAPWSQLTYGLDDQGRLNGTRVGLAQGQAGLALSGRPSAHLELALRSFYFRQGPTRKDKIEIGSEVIAVRRDFASRGVETTLEGKYDAIAGMLFVAGVELLYDLEDLPSLSHELKYATASERAGFVFETTPGRSESFVNLGVFGQASSSKWAPELSLIAGGRYDHNDVYGDQLSGRVGLVSQPTALLTLKLFGGTAFMAPSPLLLYAEPMKVGDIEGNEDLRPQYVYSAEGQVIFTPINGLVLTTSLSGNRFVDKAEFVLQGVNQVARNLAMLETLSWETELKYRSGRAVEGFASFEKTLARQQSGQEGYVDEVSSSGLTVYPELIVRAGVSASLPHAPLRVSVDALYAGARTSGVTNSLEHGGSYRLAPYVVANAMLSLDFALFHEKTTRITLRVRNVVAGEAVDAGAAGIDYPLAPALAQLELRQEL